MNLARGPLAVLLLLATVGALSAQSDWDEPFPPHRIADNLYYVGSKGLATYLITTSRGHILINSSFERTVPIIRGNVEKLGFKFADIKILLASHAHSDHVAGHALIKELTGARVEVMEGDAKVIATGGKGQYLYDEGWKPCAVDRVLKDGDTVTLGEATLTARLTPGHTRGCTTWTMQAADGGKSRNVVIIGSPNVNPGYQLVSNQDYPEIADDFAKTFRLLTSLPCDIFLGATAATTEWWRSSPGSRRIRKPILSWTRKAIGPTWRTATRTSGRSSRSKSSSSKRQRGVDSAFFRWGDRFQIRFDGGLQERVKIATHSGAQAVAERLHLA